MAYKLKATPFRHRMYKTSIMIEIKGSKLAKSNQYVKFQN